MASDFKKKLQEQLSNAIQKTREKMQKLPTNQNPQQTERKTVFSSPANSMAQIKAQVKTSDEFKQYLANKQAQQNTRFSEYSVRENTLNNQASQLRGSDRNVGLVQNSYSRTNDKNKTLTEEQKQELLKKYSNKTTTYDDLDEATKSKLEEIEKKYKQEHPEPQVSKPLSEEDKENSEKLNKKIAWESSGIGKNIKNIKENTNNMVNAINEIQENPYTDYGRALKIIKDSAQIGLDKSLQGIGNLEESLTRYVETFVLKEGYKPKNWFNAKQDLKEMEQMDEVLGTSNENKGAINSLRKNIGLDAYRNKLEKEIVETQAKLDTKVGKHIGGLLPSLTQNGMNALTAVVNPTIAATLFSTSAYQGYYEEAREKGLSRTDSEQWGLAMAYLETVSEEALTFANIRGFEDFAAGKGIKNFLVGKGANITENALQEGVMQPSGKIIENLILGKSPFEGLDDPELWKSSLNEAVAGAESAAILDVLGTGASLPFRLTNQSTENQFNSKTNEEQFKEYAQKRLDGMTEQEILEEERVNEERRTMESGETTREDRGKTYRGREETSQTQEEGNIRNEIIETLQENNITPSQENINRFMERASNFLINPSDTSNPKLKSLIQRIQDSRVEAQKVDTDNLSDIETMSLDSHDGQTDLIKQITDKNGNVVASVEYSTFEGKNYVNMIEVAPEYRRQGLAQKLLQDLQRETPSQEIIFGMTTDDGTKLIESVTEKVKNPKYNEKKAKEIANLEKQANNLRKQIEAYNDKLRPYAEKNSQGTLTDQERQEWRNLSHEQTELMEQEREVNEKLYNLEQKTSPEELKEYNTFVKLENKNDSEYNIERKRQDNNYFYKKIRNDDKARVASDYRTYPNKYKETTGFVDFSDATYGYNIVDGEIEVYSKFKGSQEYIEKVKEVLKDGANRLPIRDIKINESIRNQRRSNNNGNDVGRRSAESGENNRQIDRARGQRKQNKQTDVNGNVSKGIEDTQTERSFSLPSNEKDSEGRTLSKGQAERFKNSVVRTKEGNLLRVYHGTPTGGFTIYDKNKLGKTTGAKDSTLGVHFTDNLQMAETYRDFASDEIQEQARKEIEAKWDIRENEIVPDKLRKQINKEIDELIKKNLKENGEIKEQYINITKPFSIFADYNISEQQLADDLVYALTGSEDITETTDYYDDNMDFLLGIQQNFNNEMAEMKDELAKPEALDRLKERGYDGVILPIQTTDKIGLAKLGLNHSGNEYIVFNSNQAKNVDNLNPTDNPDIRYSLSDEELQTQEDTSEENEIDRKINQSMTMKEAEEMVQRAFIAGNIRDWYDGKYKNGREWLEGEGIDEVAMWIDNDYDLQQKYINSNDDILNEEYLIDDVLEAYKNGTLIGKAPMKASRLDVSKDTGYKDDRFYAPKQTKEGMDLYNKANTRVTNANRQEIYKARADFIINAQQPGYIESLGIDSKEALNKMKQWAGYNKTAFELSNRINKDVSMQNRWSGIENSSIVNNITVSDEQMKEMVKEVKGNSSEYERKYITSTMLAIDCHTDFSNLTFDFVDPTTKLQDRDSVLGQYNPTDDVISIRRSGQNTVSHEIGHYLDHLFGRQLFGNNRGITDAANRRNIENKNLTDNQKQFIQNFSSWFDGIESSADIGSKYKMEPTEVFARFVARFTEWTKNVATNNRYGYESKWYDDHFTNAQYIEFTKLLQEKSLLDTTEEYKNYNKKNYGSGKTKADAFEDFIFETEWAEEQKNWAEEKKQNENKAPVKKDIAPKKQTNRKQTETVENRDILDTTKTFKDGRDKQYYKYKRQTKAYDNSSLQNAMNLVNPNYQGRRDVNQWLQVAKQIGTEIADKSDAEIEQIAYRSWFEAKPNSKENLNRHGKKYVAFNSDIWLNTIYDQVKDVRENQIKAPAKQAPVKQEAKVAENASNTKQEAKLPVKENTPGETINWNEIERPEGKIRKHYKSIIESGNTTKEAKKIAKDLMGVDTYVPDSNNQQLQRADNRINATSPEVQMQALMERAVNGGKITAEDVAVGERLIQYYSQIGDAENLQEAIRTTAMMGTSAGQAVQAFAMLNHQTPQGQAIWLQKTVEKMNNDIAKRKNATVVTEENGTKVINKKGEDITDKVKLFNLTPDMVDSIVKSKNETEMIENLDNIYKELGQQVPRTAMEKVDAWRYFSMLANPKTHIRNIIGNKAMGGLQDVKNFVGGGIEDVVSKFNPNIERTKTAKFASKEVREFVKNDFKNSDVQTMLELGTDKYADPLNRIQENQKTFKSDFLENTLGKAFDVNGKLLEVEDGWGLKSAYVKSMSQYMAANNLTAENITDKQLSQARNYAVEQAKEATFHQASTLANLLNTVGKKNKVLKFVMDSAIPFKKTPINVAKAGIQYSPVQIVKGVTTDLVALRKGNITVNQYIDNISKGLTGTGIVALGFALAEMGILKGSGDDDKDKEYFDQQQGKQNFSMRIGDSTYSLDWLAPAGIPLFVGAEVNNLYHSEKEDNNTIEDKDLLGSALSAVSNLGNASITALNPMADMSMISGLTNILGTSNSAKTPGQKIGDIIANTGSSYVNQFFPTVMGQIARTIDPYERSTTSTKKGTLPRVADSTINQIKSKIPGLRQTLPAKTDIWGQEMKPVGKLPTRIFNNFINPATVKQISNDSVTKGLNMLYDKTGNSDILPESLKKELNINGKKYVLNNEDYARYRKEYEQTSHETIQELMKTDEYKELDENEKAEAISNIYDYAKEKFKVEYAESKGEEIKASKKYEVINDLEQEEVPAKDIMSYVTKFDTIKADTDSEGKEIAGSQKAKKLDWILNSNMSNTAKDTIIQNEFSTSATEDSLKNYKHIDKDYDTLLYYTNLSKDAKETYRNIAKSGVNQSKYIQYKAAQKVANNDFKALQKSKLSKVDKAKVYEMELGKDDNEYKYLKTTNIDINEYLKYKQAKSTWKADRVDDGTVAGKSVSGSKKEKVVSYINNMNVTYEQKLLLMGQQYKLSKAEQRKLANYINNMDLNQQEKLDLYGKIKGFTVYKDGRVTW